MDNDLIYIYLTFLLFIYIFYVNYNKDKSECLVLNPYIKGSFEHYSIYIPEKVIDKYIYYIELECNGKDININLEKHNSHKLKKLTHNLINFILNESNKHSNSLVNLKSKHFNRTHFNNIIYYELNTVLYDSINHIPVECVFKFKLDDSIFNVVSIERFDSNNTIPVKGLPFYKPILPSNITKSDFNEIIKNTNEKTIKRKDNYISKDLHQTFNKLSRQLDPHKIFK